MSPLELWALLGGVERESTGFFAFWAYGELTWIPTDEPGSFERCVHAYGWDGDLEVGAMTWRDRGFSFARLSHALWARCDTPKTREALARFEPAPTLVLASGARRDALWALSQGLEPRWTTRLNRRIAYRLGAVQKHGDTAFTFAPPWTVLRASGRERPVAVESWTGTLHGARAVAGRLPDPPDPDAWRDRQRAA